MLTPTPLVYVRVGTSVNNQVNWGQWQAHLVVSLRSIPKPSGYTILMRSSDYFSVMDRATIMAAWQGTISSMVTTIASNNDLTPVVEPTLGGFNLIQAHTSDFEFITERLLKRSANIGGRADFRTYVRDGELHFHTTGYKKKPYLIRHFFGPSTVVVFDDSTQKQVHLGGAGILVHVFNPHDGTISTVLSKPPTVKMAKSYPNFSGIKGGPRIVDWTIGANQPSEPVLIAQAMYELAHLEDYVITLKTDRVLLRVDDLVNLDFTQSATSLNPWSGTYAVLDAKHNVINGMVTSSITLTRGEIN
jgi:hypothetical protein